MVEICDPVGLARELRALPSALLLGFDVDGTLAPIVEDPDRARVPEATLSLLRAVHAHADFHVAFLTGRDGSALARMVPWSDPWRSVDHGATLLGPGVLDGPSPSSDEAEAIEDYARFVDALCAHTPAKVERKRWSVALHTRGIERQKADELVAAASAEAARRDLYARLGRAVYEAALQTEAHVPQRHKGDALDAIASALHARSVFFAGDDLTDFPAIDFAARHGIGAFVASGERRAPVGARVLEGTAGVVALLEALLHT